VHTFAGENEIKTTTMKFKIKANIVLSKEFEIEAENPQEAIKEIQQLLAEKNDIKSFKYSKLTYELLEPSIEV
jgi:hypothetical protein